VVDDSIESLVFFCVVVKDGCVSVADDACVLCGPVAGFSCVCYLVVDVEFEADEWVVVDEVEFFAGVGAVEVEGVGVVAEVHGDDVGCLVVGHGEAADLC